MNHSLRLFWVLFTLCSLLAAADPASSSEKTAGQAEVPDKTVAPEPKKAEEGAAAEASQPRGAGGMVINTSSTRGSGEEIPVEVTGALSRIINTSSEGLVQETLDDGKTVVVDLQGRFTSAVVATLGPDGKVVTRCYDKAPHAHADGKACKDHGEAPPAPQADPQK